MSRENKKDKNRMGQFVPGRSSEIDQCIDETTLLLRNTRAFLDGLRDSDEKTREYVKDISESLERDVQRLLSKKGEK
jgi:hypothetical protein